MVEGHGVHRVAVAHRRQLVGKRFAATSPNGRFADGARAIDQTVLQRVEAVGKNMFYFFNEREGPDAHVMHVHFGMSGRFSTHDALSCPDPTATTRLRLEHREDGIVALLSAMTVDLMDESGYHLKRSKLGQDPLREDADPDALWDKFRSARKSVGLALMDQAMFAGVGNIYRAEILYKAGVHPEQPCADLDRAQFDVVWRHTVELLQRGFVNGSILTVDPEEAAILGDPWTRRYVYNQSRCGRCGGAVKTWDMANRTVYCCETCQPRIAGTKLPPPAAKRVRETAKAHVPFVSHCAPDGAAASAADPSKLTVAKLRETLGAMGWPGGEPKRGARKADLVALLRAATATAKGEKTDADAAIDLTDEVTAPRTPAKPSRTTNAASKSEVAPSPGTRALESTMHSAEAAAMEKLAAGEKGNVEHVALADDESRAVIARAKRRAAEGPETPEGSNARRRR